MFHRELQKNKSSTLIIESWRNFIAISELWTHVTEVNEKVRNVEKPL